MTQYDVVRLLAIGVDAGFLIPVDLTAADSCQVAAAYNGIGSAEMPSWLRRALTRWLDVFQPSALIHDWQTTRLQGLGLWTPEACRASDALFYDNCCKLARWSTFCWADPRRPVLLLLAGGCLLALRIAALHGKRRL